MPSPHSGSQHIMAFNPCNGVTKIIRQSPVVVRGVLDATGCGLVLVALAAPGIGWYEKSRNLIATGSLCIGVMMVSG